jgi:RHS repeat-associated protein
MEFQDELGLNLYDMDFRDYDPAIARWTGIDPVTHHNMSPYMAFDGNPVFWADPSGADAVYDWDEHENGNVGIYKDNRVVVSFADAMRQHGMNPDGSDIGGQTAFGFSDFDINVLSY